MTDTLPMTGAEPPPPSSGGDGPVPPPGAPGPDVPPRRGRGRPPGKAKVDVPPKAPKRGRPSKSDVLERQLVELIGGIGIGVLVVNEADGMAVIAGTPRLAAALAQLAAENAAVERMLTQLLTVSTYGQLVAAVAAIAVPILANHGMVPAGVGAFVAPAATGAPGAP